MNTSYLIESILPWVSPLPKTTLRLPLGSNHSCGFGSSRKGGHNTGIDLICDPHQEVVAVESGRILAVQNFSEKKPEPWINMTRVILIEGASGVIAYGNVKEVPGLAEGEYIDAGELIGTVMPIYKSKKNKATKFKLEWYTKGTKRRGSWLSCKPKPNNMLDPTPMLIPLIAIKRRRIHAL